MIEPGRVDDADAIAAVFLAARAAAMPWLPVLHDHDDVRGFFATRVLGQCDVMVVRREGDLIGFLALCGDVVDHLYVRPQDRRRGIGSELLREAQARRPGGLELWAFQRNAPALAFYAKHGFAELFRTDGRDNEEREPDVRLGWRR
jgi:GNAT superfamily N-acetyltransferase